MALFQYLKLKICTDFRDRFARNLQHLSARLFLLLFLNSFRRATRRNNNKNNFALIHMLQISCKSEQIFRNPETIWSQIMALLENMDLSHMYSFSSKGVTNNSQSVLICCIAKLWKAESKISLGSFPKEYSRVIKRDTFKMLTSTFAAYPAENFRHSALFSFDHR